MSEFNLPEGWVETPLGEYLFLKNGHAFKSTAYVEKNVDTVPVIRISDIDGKTATDENAIHVKIENTVRGFEVKNGDLLIAMSGATTGKVGVYKGEEPAYQNQRVGNLKLHAEKYGSAKYRDHLIASLTPEILKIAYGGAQPNISGKAIEEFLVAFPPLAEQQQIAQKLDELLEQVDTLKNRLNVIPNILKRFRQSVLAAAVSGRLTEEWRGSDEYEFIDESFSIPSGWAKKTISDVCEYITSGSRGWADYYSDSGSLFIRSQDINTDELVINDAAYVSLPERTEGKRTKIKKEDLLITITGANVTKCARVKIDLDDAYVSQHVALIRLSDTELSPFVEKVLKAQNAGRKQLLGYAYGGGKPGLNLQNIKDVNIGVPSKEEQTEVVRRVEQLFTFADQIEQRVKDAQARVNHLTQSILAKAFRGELTDDWRSQNSGLISGENSAAALLQRIRAERETTAKPKRKLKV